MYFSSMYSCFYINPGHVKLAELGPVSKQRLFSRDLFLHETFSISGDKQPIKAEVTGSL